jgi:acetoin utilization deacetylase AcuC-like enzyme
VVHHPDYAQTIPDIPLDPRRADRILAFLREERIVRAESITHPHPASLEAILRVHSPGHVASLDREDVVSRVMGASLSDVQAQAVLAHQRLWAGGTIRAARLALRTGRPAMNLGGGLHHATRDQGMAFCLINDVAIAITHLRHYGFAGPILVVDLDLHDGNGTRAAFAADPSVHTYSIHNADWEPGGGAATTAIALGTGVDDPTYLAALRESLPGVVERHRPEFLFYVAGTDPAEDDRLGDWRITAAGMLERDRLVIDLARRDRPRLPVVVVLAGGYGREAWRYSARFAAWLARGAAIEPPDDLALLLRAARRTELPRDRADDWGLTEADLTGIAPGAAGGRVLGEFSPHAVELSLEQTGLLAAVRARGFTRPSVTVDPGSSLGDTIKLHGDDRRELLMELRVSRSRRIIPGMELLYVEWLLLQNPRATFTPAATRLPGQAFPGLGLLREVVAWLVRVCETLRLDGLGARPAQYYMAALSRRHMRFLDPAHQARFDALYRLLGGMPLPEAEEALTQRRVVNPATGQPVAWEPALQVYPVSPRLTELLGRAGEPLPDPPRLVLIGLNK